MLHLHKTLRRGRPKGFTVVELLVAMTLFSILSALLWDTMQGTSEVWRRSSGRDGALREMLKARSYLTRDLANASRQTGQYATGTTGPSLATGKDGDALTFLSCENGTTPWNVTETGSAVMTAEITYGLFVPQNVNSKYSYTFNGVADADGYEQGCPFKWLLRRQDPVAAAPPDPTIPANWTTTFLNRPSVTVPGAGQQIVATQLLGFRVLASGPVWQIELKAVAVEDAAHTIGIGPTALGNSTYTLVQQFTIAGHN